MTDLLEAVATIGLAGLLGYLAVRIARKVTS